MKMRPFELALVVIFLVLFIVALVMLANYSPKPKDSENAAGLKNTVTIWGTIDPEAVQEVLWAATENDETFSLVNYQYIDPEEFDWRLVNALADQRGPDLVLTSHEQLTTIRKRIYPVSYETVPLADVRSNYLDGAEIFALSDGLQALPVAVDPLMLYWNRDILSTEGYIQPPATWEQLVNTMFPDLIERDFDRTIRRGVVAMGEYGNVRNAYGVLSLLLIQAGSQLVQEDGGEYTIRINNSLSGDEPLTSAATFYTRFSQPSNTLYSWNRAQGEDRSEFVAEDLALYFGYGSEGAVIQRLNPNLNFAVAEVPQGAGATVRRTYGKFYGYSVLRTSDNFNEAWRVMFVLGGERFANQLAIESNLVPLHRTNVARGSDDIFLRSAYLSAPIARGWLNPERGATDTAFSTMVGDINGNRRTISAAVNDASSRLKLAY